MNIRIHEWAIGTAIGTVLGVIVVGVVTSCDVPTTDDAPNHVTVYGVPIVNGFQRFTVTKHGKFDAGFNNDTREILIITDTTTKRTYLGITGVGVTEMRTESTDEATTTTEP